MNRSETIREFLQGKTEMNTENEEDLFARLEEIEAQGAIVPVLSKGDWIGIAAAFLFLGLVPLLYYAVALH